MTTPRLASSLILIKPQTTQLKNPTFSILFLKRATKGTFPSFHVFPGGALNTQDGPSNFIESFRNCAQRETFEETGISLTKHSWTLEETINWRNKVYNQPELFYKLFPTSMQNKLVHWSNWMAPKEEKARFHTHFFLSCILDFDLLKYASPDGQETVFLEWMTPKEALDSFSQSKIRLMPPQFIMLLELQSMSWKDILEYMNGNKTRDVHDLQLQCPESIRSKGHVTEFVLPGDPRHSLTRDNSIQQKLEYQERVLELTRDTHGAVLDIHYRFKLLSKLI